MMGTSWQNIQALLDYVICIGSLLSEKILYLCSDTDREGKIIWWIYEFIPWPTDLPRVS